MPEVRKLLISVTTTLRETLAVIDSGSVGMALLVDDEGQLIRTITDGDIRREILAGVPLEAMAGDLPSQLPVTIEEGCSRRTALELMRVKAIHCIPVLNQAGQVIALWDRATLDNQILLSTPHMGDTERDFVEQAFATNWIAPLGPNVDAFEKEFANKVRTKHAAAVSSGTAAIHLALILLKVGRGDRVFCSSLTFAASANPIAYQGAEPVFIDADRSNWGMCAKSLERALEDGKRQGKLPKAVIVVNLYGQSSDIDPLLELCRQYDVPLIEDAAESLGATYKGKASGTLGLMGIYSFNGNKIITTSGGGMLVSEDGELIAKARFLATQARDPAPHYQHSEIGYNYRMSNILAGVGRGQLKVLDDRVSARRRIFDLYREGLRDIDGLSWLPEPTWSHSTRWLSVMTVEAGSKGRDAVIAALADDLIEARPVWKPMHLQPIFSTCPMYSVENTPVADSLFHNGICLPSGSNMLLEQIDRTIVALRQALE
jgi:dTDP-4-amino-4,6-dideoxygalactose transaminase